MLEESQQNLCACACVFSFFVFVFNVDTPVLNHLCAWFLELYGLNTEVKPRCHQPLLIPLCILSYSSVLTRCKDLFIELLFGR